MTLYTTDDVILLTTAANCVNFPSSAFPDRLWSMILSAASQLDQGPKPETRADNRCSLRMSVLVLIIPSTLWGPVARSHALMERWHQKKGLAALFRSVSRAVQISRDTASVPRMPCGVAFYYLIAGSEQRVGRQTCLIPLGMFHKKQRFTLIQGIQWRNRS